MSLRPANLPFRRDNLVLAACVLLSVTLLVLPGDVRTFVADRLGLVLTAPYWSVRNFGEDVILTRDENAWLKQRVAQLELLAAAGQRTQRDAARMAGPALDPGYAGELVPCRVVMRQRGRFATMIKIESLVDVPWEPWLPVISGSGYLGRLRTVINEREAWVELMSAPGFAVGVEFERTGLLGVLRPRGDGFVVEMVGRDEDVRAGDRLITSGIAEIREGTGDEPTPDTPRGFPVGSVADVSAPSDQIFKAIAVAPSASLDYNETVFVVTPMAAREAP
ncbi:MAG: rod shape-determining protein MreC [bacterium]|nr:rod shape-determining protein MreC [bacterium]